MKWSQKNTTLVIQLSVLAICAVTLGTTMWKALSNQKQKLAAIIPVAAHTFSQTTLSPTTPLFIPDPKIPPIPKLPPAPVVTVDAGIQDVPAPFPFEFAVELVATPKSPSVLSQPKQPQPQIQRSSPETIAESLPDIVAFAASRSGRFVIAACGDGSVRLYDTDLRTASPLAASTTPVVSVAITPDDRFAIAGYTDGTITWWRTRRNPNAPHDSFTLPHILPDLRRVELSENGRWMVAFDQSSLWLWDLATLQTNPLAPSRTWDEPIPIRGHTQPVRAIAFSRDARWLVVGSEDQQTRLYDLHAEVVGMRQCILKGHQQDVCVIAVAPDRSWIATGSYDCTIRLWDFTTDTPVPLATLVGHSGWISALTALDKHTLISGGYDQRVYLWDVAALRATGSLTAVQLTSGVGAVRTIAASDDSRFLAILGGRSSLQLWRIDPTGSAELLDTTDAVPLAGVAFDRAGRLIQATRSTLSSRTLR